MPSRNFVWTCGKVRCLIRKKKPALDSFYNAIRTARWLDSLSFFSTFTQMKKSLFVWEKTCLLSARYVCAFSEFSFLNQWTISNHTLLEWFLVHQPYIYSHYMPDLRQLNIVQLVNSSGEFGLPLTHTKENNAKIQINAILVRFYYLLNKKYEQLPKLD